MKRVKIFTIILTILLVSQLCIKPSIVQAKLEEYNFIAVDNGDFNILMRIRNKINNEGYFYAGYKLSDYYISGNAYYKDIPYAAIEWYNEDYVIVEGRQIIDIDLPGIFDGVNKLSIEIEGKLEPLKTTPLQTERQKPEKKKVYGGNYKEYVFDGITGFSYEEIIPKMIFIGQDGVELTGKFSIPDWDSSKEGLYEFNWIFEPDDSSYETKTGIVKVKFYKAVNWEEFEKEQNSIPTPPSLTATKIILAKNAFYDINIDNKIKGASYSWSSSDENVAKVNAKNGLVTAISEGSTVITCKITIPDGTTQELTSIVYVEYDDNAVVLSDSELNLEIGEKYTLKAENVPVNAKIKFTSSDKSIIKVGTINGKITALKEGNAYVTCTVTDDTQVIVLRCDITVE